MTCRIANAKEDQSIATLGQIHCLCIPGLPGYWIVHMASDIGRFALMKPIDEWLAIVLLLHGYLRQGCHSSFW